MTDARRIYRALIVQRYTAVSWDEWIRATSRADGGTDPTNEHANQPNHDAQNPDQTSESAQKHRAR